MGGSTEMAEKETARMEAFSDGVFAIAVTLLVLELHVPKVEPGGSLSEALLRMWPSYFGYVVSFFTILVMWINHHRLFRLVCRSDEVLPILNGVLLLLITFVPFPTAVLAEHVQTDQRQGAALFYSGSFFVLALAFNVLWHWISHKNRLIDPASDPVHVRGISWQYAGGPFLYGSATLLAFVSVPLCLAVNFGLVVFFAMPGSVLHRVARR